jgi:TldD protein
VKIALLAAVGRSRADHTEIRFYRRHGSRLALRCRRPEYVGRVSEQWGVVRCGHRGRAWGRATFRSEDDLPAAVQSAAELSLALPVGGPLALAPIPIREADFPCPDGRDPGRVSEAVKWSLVEALAATLTEVDRRVVDVRARYDEGTEENWLVTSEGVVLREVRPEMSLAAMVVVEEEGNVERAAASIATAGRWEEVETWVTGASRIADRAIARLRAAPVRPGRLPVVLDPRFAGVWVHRAIGHRCVAGVGDTAPLPLGTRVGPDVLTIGDDGTALGLRGTLAFDHEGAPPQNTVLVRHGLVVQHAHTRETAHAAGAAVTGNARAVADGAPEARLTNTYLANGRGDLSEVLRDVALGVYLAEPEAVTFDRGRITMHAGFARMIRRGELAEAVKHVALTGDALGLFGLVDAVAGDFQWDTGASTCHRRGEAALPVSVGAPHLRLVEAQLGEVA